MSHTLYNWSGWFEISDLYTIKTVGTSATLSDDFDKSVTTFEEIRAVSDTATLAELFAKDDPLYTYRENRSVSTSATLADSFPTPTLDDWKIIKIVSDSASLAESFVKESPLHQWLYPRSVSDTATLADSFATPTLDYWKLIRSVSDTATLADSFPTPTIDDWKHIRSTSDSATLAESFAKESPLHQWLYSRTVSDSSTLSDDFDYDDPLYTYRTDRSTSDTATLAESFPTPTIDYWHLPRAVADSATLAEAFAKSTYIYRTDRSVGTSATVADSFPTPTIDTWYHELSTSMSATLDDDFDDPSLRYWRKDSSVGTSATIGESFAYTDPLDNWKYLRNVSTTINASDTFDEDTSYWRSVRAVSNSVSLGDSFTAQLVVNQDTYYYDTISLSSATTTIGYVSGGSWTSSAGRVTNVEGLTDGQISRPATFSGNTLAGVRFDLGTQTPTDFICVHLRSGMNDTIKLFGSNSQGSGYTLLETPTTGQGNWTINEFPVSANNRYYVLQLEASTIDSEVDEIIIGMKFKPEIRYDLGSSTQMKTNTAISTSYAGNEYSYRKGEASYAFKKKYANLSATLKSDFESLREKTNGKKFIYYDQNSADKINYVYADPINFSEVSHNRYSTDFKLST